MAKDPISDRLARARRATLGKPQTFRVIGVEIDDPEKPGEPILFAVRGPTVKEKAEIIKAATNMEALKQGRTDLDTAKLRVEAMMKLTFVGEPVLDSDGKPARETYVVMDGLGRPEMIEKLGDDGQPELDDESLPILVEKTASRPLAKVAHDDNGLPERVFEVGQRDALLKGPDGDWFAPLADAAMELFNRNMEDARKSP